MSGKGGVGKTTIAVNIAYGLFMQGYSVGVLDIDIHGPNVAKMLGIEKERLRGSRERLEPVCVFPHFKVVSLALFGYEPDQAIIWRGPMKMNIIRQFLADTNWGELDYLIIDAPPGTGDEPLSIAQLVNPLDAAIIVTTPQDVAILDSRKSITFAKELHIPFVGVVENMSGFICPHCKRKVPLFGEGGGGRTARELSVPLLGRIPIEPMITSTGDSGKPFIYYNQKTPTADAFEHILQTIIEYVPVFQTSNTKGE